MARWEKGQSGNPTGRPKVQPEYKRRCQKAVDELCIAAWISEVETRGKDWVKCSELIAAYGVGKPSQPVEHSGSDGEPLSITVEFVGERQGQ